MAVLFADFDEIRGAIQSLPQGNHASVEAARFRDSRLTKPSGALGRLEDCVRHLARWQGRELPGLASVRIEIFAGNHGVTARGVSAFPAEVTVQMVANFRNGGAAINQLAKLHGADLTVTALDLERPTADFTQAAAMSEAECLAAINAGANQVSRDTDLLIVGEMGIGNTTAAAAVSAGILGGTGRDWAGRGTGVDDRGIAAKIAAVDTALSLHAAVLGDPLQVLRCVGGRELAAMTGAILQARRLSVPVLLDGFVVTASAAILWGLSPDSLQHCIAGHVSAEAAHRRLLDSLQLAPLLDLGLRLGEGSGAAAALGVLKAAVACHAGMATFAEAMVSGKDNMQPGN